MRARRLAFVIAILLACSRSPGGEENYKAERKALVQISMT
jgi:hypothetical protein